MKRFVSSRLLLLLLQVAALQQQPVMALETRMLGNLEMQMRSRTPSDMNAVLLKIMSVTVTFLDQAFQQAFPAGDFATDQDFEKISLSVNSYGMELAGDGGYIARASFQSRAFFQDGTAPSEQDAVDLTKRTLLEKNQEFLQALIDTNNPFLADIRYAVVQVNGEGLNDDPAAAANKGSNSSSWMDHNWVLGLLAGASAFLLVLVVCWLCIWCMPINEDGVVGNMIQHNLASASSGGGGGVKKTVSKASSGKTSKESESPANSHRSPSPVRSITSQDSSIFTYNPKSNKSTASSTIFTYGNNNHPLSNKSVGTTTMFGASSTVFTSSSGVELDVEAWKKGSTVQGKDTSIFGGQNISAIEPKKDLSLIEEVSEDSEHPSQQHDNAENMLPRHRKAATASSDPHHSALTAKALDDLERGERQLLQQQQQRRSRSAHSRPTVTTTAYHHHHHSHHHAPRVMSPSSSAATAFSYHSRARSVARTTASTASTALMANTTSNRDADVIMELNDLSHQFANHRHPLR